MLGTVTAVRSSIRSSRASSNASRPSVLTRSPGARRIFDGAATSHRNPAAVRSRASPNPVGPASYVTATGPGSSASHAMIAATVGPQPPLPHLTGDRVQTCRRDRSGVHIQTNTRTLCKHRGLPTTHVG